CSSILVWFYNKQKSILGLLIAIIMTSVIGGDNQVGDGDQSQTWWAGGQVSWMHLSRTQHTEHCVATGVELLQAEAESSVPGQVADAVQGVEGKSSSWKCKNGQSRATGRGHRSIPANSLTVVRRKLGRVSLTVLR